MHIQGEDGFSVIDYDQTAFEVHVANDGGAPGVGGSDFGARRGRIIEAPVSTLRPAIVDAAHAEGRSVTGIGRRREGPLPKTLGRRGFEHRALDRQFLIDSGLNLFGRLYEPLRHFNGGGRIEVSLYRDPDGLAIQDERVAAGRAIEADACES